MFGFTIVRTARLKELERRVYCYHSILYYTDWFSGWPHVYSLLKQFREGKVGAGNIWGVRSDFAKTMNTDDWGNPLTATASEGEKR